MPPSLAHIQNQTASKEPAIFGFYRNIYDTYDGDKELIKAGIIAIHESGRDKNALPSIAELEEAGSRALGRPVPEPEAKTEQRGFVSEAASALGAGMVSTAESITGAMEMAGLEAGKIGREHWTKAGEAESLKRPEYLQEETVWEHPERLGDWRWWTRSLGENIPNMAAMMLPGLGTMKAAQVAGWGTRAIKSAGMAGAWSGAATVESGAAYNQAKQEMTDMKVFSDNEIEQIATAEGLAVGAINGVLEAIPFATLFTGAAGAPAKSAARRIIGRVVRQAMAEGQTEMAQEAVSIYAEQLGHHPDLKWGEQIGRILESGIIGAALGGGAAVPGGAAMDEIEQDRQKDQRLRDIIADQPGATSETLVTETATEPRLKNIVEERDQKQEKEDIRKRAQNLLSAITAEVEQEELAAPEIAQPGPAPTPGMPTQTPPIEQELPTPAGAPTSAEAQGSGRTAQGAEFVSRSGGMLLEEIPASPEGFAVTGPGPEMTETGEPGPEERKKRKEPWEMTRERVVWGENISPDGLSTDRALAGRLARWEKIKREAEAEGRTIEAVEQAIVTETARIERANSHKAAVKQALSEGRDVPGEVLAEYPDLVKKPEKAEEELKPAEKPAQEPRGSTKAPEVIPETPPKIDVLPPHAIRKQTSGTSKGQYMAWVTEGDHKDTIAFGNDKAQAEKVLLKNVNERVAKGIKNLPKKKGQGITAITGRKLTEKTEAKKGETLVDVPAIREATGEKITIKQEAREAWEDVKEQIKIFRQLLECVA